MGMTLKCLGYLFKHKKWLFHQKLKKNNKFFLKCHSHLQFFRIGNKGIFYHTWCESSKPLLSYQIVLMIERPQLWQKSRKTMNLSKKKIFFRAPRGRHGPKLKIRKCPKKLSAPNFKNPKYFFLYVLKGPFQHI